MADLKISQLQPYTNAEANDSDVMPIVDAVAGETKKISLFELDKRWRALPTGGTVNQVLAKLSSTDGDVQWLTITKSTIGLGQVNNTADVDKPLSNATITALNGKASTAVVAAKADKTYVDTELLTKQDNLPSGTDGQVLGLVGGVETWVDPPSSTGSIVSIGNPTIDGSWRIRNDAAVLKFEIRVGGTWVTATEFNAP